MGLSKSIYRAATIALQTGWPSIWTGSPGTGKTQTFYSIARHFFREAVAAGTIPEDTKFESFAPDFVLGQMAP